MTQACLLAETKRRVDIKCPNTTSGHQSRYQSGALPSVPLKLEGRRLRDVVDLVLVRGAVDYVDLVEEEHEQDQVTWRDCYVI